MTCISPLKVKQKDGFVTVPCGKCYACLHRRRQQWSFRLKEELKSSSSAHFVTLTYSDEHLPRSDIGFPIVCKRDVQLWMKRLRKRLQASGDKIRYFLVSEYGSRTKRPHYHAILFNLPIELDLNDTLVSTWQLGHVHIGSVTDASISYCAKYCMAYEEDFPEEITRPFMLCSKRPPIGGTYLTPEMVHYHKVGYRNYTTLPGGKKGSLPRFYKDKIFSQHEKEIIKSQILPQVEPEVDIERIERGLPSKSTEELLHRVKAMRSRLSKNEKL